jgi:hypothetical protein
MPPPRRRRAERALLASACAVVTAFLGGGAAHAEGVRAELSVAVSVVRACSVATPALVVVGDEVARDGAAARIGDALSLRCSEGGAASVYVGPPSLHGALHPLLALDLAAAASSPLGAREPVVVTVLF